MNRLLIRDCIFNTDHVALIAWTRDENVLTVSLSSGKYMEFKDFPESEWKRLRETLGFTVEKERERFPIQKAGFEQPKGCVL
jgi:hypothetical protein